MANSIAAVLPQFWALEGLRRLMELTPAVNSVNRQFADDLASAGDTVNAWRADRRVVRRKTRSDEYTATDADITPVPVKLDQYFFDTIVIKDEEQALSIPELTRTHLMPMIEAIARGMDRAVLGRVHAFLRQGSPLKRAGRLNKISTSNAEDFILEAEEVLIGNLAPMEGLWTAIIHHTANTKLMGTDTFKRADARGQDQAVVTGQVGTIFNTRVLVSQNVNYVYSPTSDIQTSTINNSGGYAAGTATALTVVDPGTDWTVGEYVVVDGNDQPTFVSVTGGATSITLNEELKYAVIDTAPITHFLKGANEATERAAGYQKSMTFTHTAAKNYQIGQLISFGTGASRHTYTIIEVSATASTTTTCLLDRPLDATVASGADCFPGPHGSMNPVMHEDAIAFVSRNMRIPQGRDGANGAVQNFRGVGLRVVTQYDSLVGGVRVNVDVLAGIAVLDEDLLVVMCA
jgi:hypothetical protein